MTSSSFTMSKRKSSGISRNTGPGTLVVATRNAVVTYSPRRRALGTETAHLVIGRIRSTWFMSCSAAHVLEQARRLAADDDHRDVGAPRGRDAGDGVGEPGPGGHDRDAGLPGDARPAVGRVRRRLLVAHVDDADALVEAAVVDRHDVPAAEREDVRHALLLERARDDPSSVHRHELGLLPGISTAGSGAELDLLDVGNLLAQVCAEPSS